MDTAFFKDSLQYYLDEIVYNRHFSKKNFLDGDISHDEFMFASIHYIHFLEKEQPSINKRAIQKIRESLLARLNLCYDIAQEKLYRFLEGPAIDPKTKEIFSSKK